MSLIPREYWLGESRESEAGGCTAETGEWHATERRARAGNAYAEYTVGGMDICRGE